MASIPNVSTGRRLNRFRPDMKATLPLVSGSPVSARTTWPEIERLGGWSRYMQPGSTVRAAANINRGAFMLPNETQRPAPDAERGKQNRRTHNPDAPPKPRAGAGSLERP